MINKKILAVAVASALSFNASAIVNLDADTGSLLIAAESIGATDLSDGTNSTIGLVKLTGANLTVAVDIGFSIAKTTSKYVRYDLTNGEFETIVDIDDATNTAVTLVSAGGVGENFAVFELAADVGTITAADTITLDATYAMTDGAALSIQYRLFETAQEAVTADTDGLAGENGTIAGISSVVTGTFSTVAVAQAKVASQFQDFDGNGDETNNLNVIQGTALVDVTPATTTTDGATLFDGTSLGFGAAKMTFSGNFTFGMFTYNGATWSVDDEGDLIVTGSAVENIDGTVTVDYAASTFEVDLEDTDGTVDVAVKGAYSAVLTGVIATGVTTPSTAVGTFTEASGTITYDTTTISVPYLTTFSDYKQRLYIVNASGQPASYTTTFVSEDGTLTDDASETNGTIPANSMKMILSSNLVAISGDTTRTSATIEIEAQGSAITATSQTVAQDGSTDTVELFGNKDAVIADICEVTGC
jgi:hypothetical protein